MTEDSPRARLRENAVGVASVLVTGIWMAAMFTGQGWWLAALLVGYIVVVPLVAMVYGDEEDRAEWWSDWTDRDRPQREREHDPGREHRHTSAGHRDPPIDTADPLETLRRRYARGELTDEQFERKLERLLETETLEDAEDRVRTRELLRERT